MRERFHRDWVIQSILKVKQSVWFYPPDMGRCDLVLQGCRYTMMFLCSFHLTRAPSDAQYKDPAAGVWRHLYFEVYRWHHRSGTGLLRMEERRNEGRELGGRAVDQGGRAEGYEQFWYPWEVLLQAEDPREDRWSQRSRSQPNRYVPSGQFKHTYLISLFKGSP